MFNNTDLIKNSGNIKKMTNMEDKGDESCNARMAALLAVHLVGQVLDEANIIANAARESGQPWRYLMMMKNLRGDKTYKICNEDVSYATSKGDNATFITSKRDDAKEMCDGKEEVLSKLVVTSTPQKKSDAVGNDVTENHLIGQGDEEFEKAENDVTIYTSTYINHLFDMSEVEKVFYDNGSTYCDNVSTCSEAKTTSIQDITTIIESYVNAALSMVRISEFKKNEPQYTRNSASSTDLSCYSFLSDAFVVDMAQDNAFFIDDGECNVRETSSEPTIEVEPSKKDLTLKDDEAIEKINAALYENVYLTLNRLGSFLIQFESVLVISDLNQVYGDYEQFSEDGGPILLDPKGLSLQEVELMTAQTSEEDLCLTHEQPENSKGLAATSAVSASVSGSRKSSLVHRCRTQGVRLLACLRGWWRRKTPGKRKESLVSGSIRGLCPLSPEARRRAASMLNQRHLCSPNTSRPFLWKFNTINETMVNSSCWKEYAFDIMPDKCNED